MLCSFPRLISSTYVSLSENSPALSGKPSEYATDSSQRVHRKPSWWHFNQQDSLHLQEDLTRRLDKAKRDHADSMEAMRKSHNREIERLQRLLDQATKERLEYSNTNSILQAELARTQQDIASLRDQMKLNEEMEPRQVVSKFNEIQAAINNTCYEIVEDVGATFGNTNLSTLQVQVDLERLQAISAGPPPSLWKSESGEGRPLDEILEHRSADIVIPGFFFLTLFICYPAYA